MADPTETSGILATALAEAPAAEAGLHRVVVVGGGAGGLELASKLGDTLGKKGKASIRLVERDRIHMWKPLLHEVAAGSLDVDEHGLDYLAHAHWHHYQVHFGEMVGLDRAAREVITGSVTDEDGREIVPMRRLGYDTLVIAVGSTTNDFGTPGVQEHAISLVTQAQATRFNRRLVNACLRAQNQTEPIRPGQLHVAIIGAGATGTELSAELHRTARQVVSFGLDRIDPDRDIKITLIEAAPRILPALPERISGPTAELLKKLNVEVLVNSRVSAVRADGVELADGRFVPSELVVWSAGVKGPPILADLDGLEVGRTNQLVVLPTLQTTRDPDIFAIGDCAEAPRGDREGPTPPRAQAAHQMASLMVRQIRHRLRGEPLETFVYKDFGSLVSLGDYTAIGNLMGFAVGRSLLIEGVLARLAYRSLYTMHQRALHGWFRTGLASLGRTITRQTEPRVKLH